MFGYFSTPPKEHRDRKPFRAFSESNDLRKKKAKGHVPAFRIGNPWEDAGQSRIQKIFGLLIGLFLIGLVIFFIAYVIQKYQKSAPEMAIRHKQFVDSQNNADYDFLLKSGYGALRAGQLEIAKSEFENAMKVYPYGEKAVVGLVTTLVRFCKEKKQYCAESAQWNEFMEKQFPEAALKIKDQ